MKSVKKILFLLILNFVIINLNAQTGLNFQGVARTTNNVILTSQAISIRLSIIRGNNDGTKTEEYVETRKVNTNAQGLFTAVIGDTGAISTLGNFATINWKLSPKFLKIEMDPAAGTNFITMGTTQFQYVAYAQFAKSVDAENIVGIVPVTLGGTGVNSLTGLKTALTINNVNNTSDLSKPISTLTQTALDLKLNAVDTSKYTKQTYSDSSLLTKLKISDTAAMLSRRIDRDTLSLSNRINSKISLSGSVLFQNDIKINGHNIGRGSGNLINNIAIGDSALSFNKTGYSNLAIGVNALKYNTTGYSNTGIGYQVLNNNTTGYQNISIGYKSLFSNTTGLYNSSLGFESMLNNTSGSGNVSFGVGSLKSNTGGEYNVSVGSYSMRDNIIGYGNAAFGTNSLMSNTYGNHNVAIGFASLHNNTTGSENIAIGKEVLMQNSVGENNIAIGRGALYHNSNSNYNIAIGQGTLQNGNNGSNIAIGYNSQSNNASGTYNTSIGIESMLNNSSGIKNTALGFNAMISNTTFSNSTALGYNAQVTASNQIQLGDANVTDVKTSGNVTAKKFTSITANAYNFSTGTNNVDLSLSNIFTINLAGNITLTFSNGTPGTYIIKLIQDGTGSRTVTFPVTNWKWAGGSIPTLTTTANKTDIVSIIYDGTTFYSTIVKDF